MGPGVDDGMKLGYVIEIALTTGDVAAAFQRALGVGAARVAEPKVKPWGQTVAYVRDLDGILVEIASEMGS